MKIHHDSQKCIELITQFYSEYGSKVLQQSEVKHLLNCHLEPEKFLFFENERGLLPLVIKNEEAVFYGGNLPYNDYNILRADKTLINEALKYLAENEISFKLLSIENDCLGLLDTAYKKYDVPYNQNWVYKNLRGFDMNEYIGRFSRKKRNKLRKAIQNQNRYTINQVELATFVEDYSPSVVRLKSEIFRRRNKENVWSHQKDLYLDILRVLGHNFPTINRTFVLKDTGDLCAAYNLVVGEKEIFLAFADCLTLDDEYLMFALYLDILTQAAKIAKISPTQPNVLNAGRGSFTYKKRMGFDPVPMYALVSAKDWKIEYNKDLSPEETFNLYGRGFGALNA